MWLDKIREMKEKSDLTTKEIAFLSKIPEPTLEKIFSGATKDPKLETMRQLVHFFGYTLDDLEDGPLRDKKSPPSAVESGLSEREYQILGMVKELTPAEQNFLVQWLKSTLEQGR